MISLLKQLKTVFQKSQPSESTGSFLDQGLEQGSVFSRENLAESLTENLTENLTESLTENLAIPSKIPENSENKWVIDYQQVPWLDQENAHELLDAKYQQGEITDPQYYQWLKQWIEDGYFIIDNLIPPSTIDQMTADLNQLWYAAEPVPGMIIYHLGLNREDCRDYTHEEVLSLPVEVREQMRDHSNWRIHGLQAVTAGAKAVFSTPQIKALASLIFNQECEPKYSISFQGGSQQRLHEDMAVFHIMPLNHILGVWIAAEDISPDSGPLIFYPGSHKEPLYEGFKNYPQTNVRTASPDSKKVYFEAVKKRAEKYPKKEFLGKKGQVLFWHGMLIHGGAEIKNPNLTRRSFVMHCIPDGCDRATEVHGPFNW